MNYFILYPASFFLNFTSFTIIMVFLNFLDFPLLSVYIAIIHSIGLFAIKSFSGEARTLANHKNLKISSDTYFKLRFLLTIPCVLLFSFFAIYISNLNFTIFIPFLIRLILEWFEEIFLIQIEKDKDLSKLKFIFLFQLLSILFCLIIILTFKDFFLPLLFWSFSSLFFFKNFYINFLQKIKINFRNQNLKKFFKFDNFNLISSNILSTFLLGFLVFVFRETILNFTGINNSSNFFTAFAIGGVLASYFSNSLGHKSTVFFNRKITTSDFILIFILLIKLFSGILLVYLTFFYPNIFKFSDDPLFFRCLGFSLVGSTFMIIAQIKRFKILKNENSDFLGINLLVNMILVILIPLFYYLFNISSISIIYLISGVLHLIFVFSFENNLPKNFKNFVAKLTILLIIIPIFFQLTGQVFINSWNVEADIYNYHLGTVPFIFNHNNELALLPLPFSLVTCIFFVFIIGDYKNAKLAFILISSTLLVCTTIIIASKLKVELMNLKFINLCQVIIPYVGIIVGLIIFKKNILEKLIFEKLLFYILILFLPLQIGFTYLQNIPILTPFMYFFSIYQHLQYVPTIFLASFIIVFFQLWDVKNYRYFLIPLTLIMLIYCYMSNSTLVIYLFYSFLIIFLIFKIRIKFSFNSKILVLTFALIITALFTKFFNVDSKLNIINHFSGKAEVLEVNEDSFKTILKDKFPGILLQLEERINKWTYYYNLINENNFILYGENETRKIDFEPHNYYIDMVYNFGILSLIPIIILSAYTFSQMLNFYKIRRKINSRDLTTVFTLFFIICFFIFVDNNLKVSLKQPYSGIFIFFIWGKLLSNLNIFLKNNQCARSSAR